MTHKDALEALNYLFNEWPRLTAIGRNQGKSHAVKCYQTIRQALQSQPCVDVEGLKRNVEEMIGFDYDDLDIDLVNLLEGNGWDNCLDHLHNRGLIGGLPEWEELDLNFMDAACYSEGLSVDEDELKLLEVFYNGLRYQERSKGDAD